MCTANTRCRSMEMVQGGAWWGCMEVHRGARSCMELHGDEVHGFALRCMDVHVQRVKEVQVERGAGAGVWRSMEEVHGGA